MHHLGVKLLSAAVPSRFLNAPLSIHRRIPVGTVILFKYQMPKMRRPSPLQVALLCDPLGSVAGATRQAEEEEDKEEEGLP